MACKMKMRRDDIPKRKGEKTWACEECGALVFAATRPNCQAKVQAEIVARHALADADLDARTHRRKP